MNKDRKQKLIQLFLVAIGAYLLLFAGGVFDTGSSDSDYGHKDQKASSTHSGKTIKDKKQKEKSEATEASHAEEEREDEYSEAGSEDHKADQPDGKVHSGVVSIKAQAGDSQTLIARQVVEDFAESIDMDLSVARIVFVETNLVQDMGADDTIDIGDSVSFNLQQVSNLVGQAQDLTPQQIAAWSVYAVNTNLY